MENKIIEDSKDNDNDFFTIKSKNEEIAKKYQELYDYLIKDEYGIRCDLDKLKKDYPKSNDLLVCAIFAVNFWRKKEKEKDKNDFCLLNYDDDQEEKNKINVNVLNVIDDKKEKERNDFFLLNDDDAQEGKNKIININEIDDNDKIDEKANEIKRMIEALNYNIEPYDIDTGIAKYDWDIQKQIDIVNSIEKIFGAFMSVNPKLFEIKKFDDFMNMSNEEYAEFYNVIWAAKILSLLSQEKKSIVETFISRYKIFLNNNKVLDEKTEKDGQDCSLAKMNLSLNEKDLEKIETRIEQISKLEYYITSLDCAFTSDNFNSIKKKMSKDNDIVGLLNCSEEELREKCNEIREQCDKSLDIDLLESNQKFANLYVTFYNMKQNIDDISKSISNLQNPPAEEIKNNLEEKISWNNKCTIEMRENFFKITATVDKMRKTYKEHMDFVKGNSIFADLQKPIDDVVKRFSDINPDLQLKDGEYKGDEPKITIEGELRKKYKDVHVATFAVNYLHKNDQKINDDQKIDESIAIMHTLEINKDDPVGDLNKAACVIEKIFLAFVDVDIKAFDIKKFDDFVNMDAKTYMEFIEIVTASTHAYKFIEKYQDFINANENIDKDIKELTDKFRSGDQQTKLLYSAEKDLENAINDYEKSKINLTLSKSDFEKVKKIIDRISGFAEYFYALKSVFDDNIANAYYSYLEKIDEKHANAYLSLNDDQKNEALDSFLKSSLTKNFDELKSFWSNASGCLSNLSYWLMCLKKNIFNILLDPEKLQIKEETINKLKNKVNEQENVNAKESDEKNIKLIKDSYQKIEEDVFNKKYKYYDYSDCVEKFQEAGKQEVQKEIKKTNDKESTIASEFIEVEETNAQNRINQFKKIIEDKEKSNEDCQSCKEDLEKYKRKIERIQQYKEKKQTPIIFVDDKYFADEYVKCNEELYPNNEITLFDENDKFIVKQGDNTCYIMSIFIELISRGMGRYVQQEIIREYEKDKNRAVVRLFDGNGCPIDFVVDKTKPKGDERPLWINMVEKAASVIMNKTQFKNSDKHGRFGAQIIKDVDWMELTQKQQSGEIFDKKVFSKSDISNGTESLGIQMILGKTCKKKTTGKVGRKIKYAKEGDEALGFLNEALSKGKLVVGSTYCPGDKNKEIPYNKNGYDYVGFDGDFKISAMHIVCFESVDWENKQITTIDSISGKNIISFADFKKYFSDIHVTDFPKEAEILKKQEKLEKEANEIFNTLNRYEKNITDLDLTGLGQSIQETDKKLKFFQGTIKNAQDDLDKDKLSVCDRIESEIKSLGDDISKNLEKLEKQKNDFCNATKNTIENLNNQISKFQKAIKENNDARNTIEKDINEITSFVKKVDESKKDIDSLVKSIDDNLSIGNIKSLNLDELNSKQTLINGTVANNIQTLKNKLNGMQTKIPDIVSKIRDIKANLEKQVANESTINTTKQSLDDQILQAIESCKIETKKLGELKDYSKKQQEVASSIQRLSDKIGSYEGKISTMGKNITTLKQNKENIENDINKHSDTIKKARKNLNELNYAKEKLEKLKGNPDAATDFKNQIEKKLNELKTKIDDIQTQTEQLSKQIDELKTGLQNQNNNFKKFNQDKQCFQTEISNGSQQLSKLEFNQDSNEVNKIKEKFQTQINVDLWKLNNLSTGLQNSDKDIKKFNDNAEDFQKQIGQIEETVKTPGGYIKQQMSKLQEIETKKKALDTILSNAIREKYATIYAITSNKIKKWGIIITVGGTIGSGCVLIIPGVAIGFIFIPSPFVLLGLVLLGIYFYREKKKPLLPIGIAGYTKKGSIISNNDVKVQSLNNEILTYNNEDPYGDGIDDKK